MTIQGDRSVVFAPLRTPKAIKKEGVKADTGKNQLDLLPPEALEAIGQIFTYGATKYEAHNWERGLKYSRVYAALLRHLFAFWKGETKDPETGLHPLAHAGCNLLFLLTYELRGMGKEFDDRFVLKKTESITDYNYHFKEHLKYDSPNMKNSDESDPCNNRNNKAFLISDYGFFNDNTEKYEYLCLNLYRCYKLQPDCFFHSDHSLWLQKLVQMDFPHVNNSITKSIQTLSDKFYDIEVARFIATGIKLDHNRDNKFVQFYNTKLVFPSFIPQSIRDLIIDWSKFSKEIAISYYNYNKKHNNFWKDLYIHMYDIFKSFMVDSFGRSEISMVTYWFLANFDKNVIILAILYGYGILDKGTPIGLGNGVFDE